MVIEPVTCSPAEIALSRLEGWLQGMRGADGYSGPVVHWWRDCLLFSGAALDWRYEGIIAGYLTLLERTGEACWLEKARVAAGDAVRRQLPGGCFPDSCFEFNPGTGGTPHEAAVDVGLLLLAKTMSDRGDDGWQSCLAAAERNLTHFYIAHLWCESEQQFRDDPAQASFVPNKAATLIEALCLLVEATGQVEWLQKYVRPTADAIVAHQARRTGSAFDGAIAQNTLGSAIVEKYFPYYIARCVPGLVAAGRALNDERYVDAAAAAMEFVWRCRDADGGFPQVIYGNGRANRYPRWIAAAGDILRAADLLQPYGLAVPREPTMAWLLSGQLPSGAFATADGFASQVSQRPARRRDFRDLLPVCGWNDKAFRFLATQVEGPMNASPASDPWTRGCSFNGSAVELSEDSRQISMGRPASPLYVWRKGASWAETKGDARCRS